MITGGHLRIITGELQFGQTTKSISGHPLKGTEEAIGCYMVEKWELPCLYLNNETNCFEPTGKTYNRWTATKGMSGRSTTTYFKTLAEAEIFSLTH